MNHQREQFFLPPDVHYLNCAYMAPNSRRVEAAGLEAVRLKNRPDRILPGHFFEGSEALRQLFARVIHAPSQRCALIPSVSYGLATVAKNLKLSKGKTIVLAGSQFPSNVYVWQRLAAERGLEIRFVDPPSEARPGRGWNERLLEMIDERTGLVAMGNVHWATGTVFDLENLARRAREVGSYFVLDGTQSVGALPLDVKALKPDALICAGYKWLMGPYGLGMAYYGPAFDDGGPLEENWIARLHSERFERLVDYQPEYQPGAVRFDMGERSQFILVPMLAEALRQILEWSVPAVQTYCRGLADRIIGGLEPLGFVAEEPEYRAGHLFSLRCPPELDSNFLQGELLRKGVYVSVRGEQVRISPHVYNVVNDVEALVQAASEITAR